MSKKRITIHDIAKELNVSASTVSRALQNHPRISQATREAVTKLASQYNYHPNVVATSLRKGKSKSVGVVVPRINRNFFANVIGGMEETLAASGYRLMICQTREKEADEISAIQTLTNARVDAILLSISMETTAGDHLRRLKDSGIHLYFFDRVLEDIKAGSVVCDDLLGAYLSVKHLIKQGYRKIIHVAGSSQISIYRERKKGFLKAMSEAGLDVPPSWIMEKPLILEGGKSAFLQGMEMKRTPDAYFCAGDFAALGVMLAAKSAGFTIPNDVGISGFANEPFTEYLDPSLTTIDQRGSEMGKIVAGMFLRNGENTPYSHDHEKIVLTPELIIRNSSLLIKKTSIHGNKL